MYTIHFTDEKRDSRKLARAQLMVIPAQILLLQSLLCYSCLILTSSDHWYTYEKTGYLILIAEK